MKTFIYSLFFTLVSSFSLAQIVNIPDARFKQYLLDPNSGINTNGDDEIQVSEAIAFTGIIACVSQDIYSLEGIGAFVNITALSCIDNHLTSLDLSNNKQLIAMACWGNNLTTLDLSVNTKLENIQCISNNLTSLILGDNQVLSFLWCDGNKLTTLDLSKNIGLERLECGDNKLTSLKLPSTNKLKQIQLISNQLTELDLSGYPALKGVWISENKFTRVNIKNGNNTNLEIFDVAENPELTCIQVDDVNYSQTNWTYVDATANFSTNCDAFMSVDSFSKNSIKIYPNPAKNIVHFSEQTNVEIFNSLGQKVKSEKNIKSIDVSKLSKGIYFIILKDNSGKEIQKTKIIKE